MGNVIVDGDIIAYRAAASLESKFFREVVVVKYMADQGVSEGTAKEQLRPLYIHRKSEKFKHDFCAWAEPKSKVHYKVDHIMDAVLTGATGMPFCTKDCCSVFLTGDTNFRQEVAVSHVYKGTRESPSKPFVLKAAKAYMEYAWDAVTSVNEEADDLIAKAACKFDYRCVVASIDKDMLQLPCWHYNIVNRSWTNVSDFDAMLFFYTQMLTGDAVDNIKGVTGVGPKIAARVLSGAKTEKDMYKVILKAYDNDIARITENGRLLWLRRYDNEMWNPPSS